MYVCYVPKITKAQTYMPRESEREIAAVFHTMQNRDELNVLNAYC